MYRVRYNRQRHEVLNKEDKNHSPVKDEDLQDRVKMLLRRFLASTVSKFQRRM